MNKALCSLLIAGLMFSSSWRLASAEEKTQEQARVRGQAVSGVQTVFEGKRSAKFYEYRDVPKDVVFNSFDLSVDKGKTYVVVRASRIRQADARYDLAIGEYGKYRIELGYDRIPHRLSFSGKTLYTEDGLGYLGLADGLQTLLQNTVGDGSANSTAFMPAARILLKSFLMGAYGLDLDVQRNKYSLNFSITPSVPLSLSVSASYETRDGHRAVGAALGTGYPIEVAAPVQFGTSEIEASAELSQKWGTVRVGYFVSLFDDDTESLTWDNPYRLTSQFMSSGDNRTALGRLALPPSNMAQKFFLSGSARILKSTWLHASASYGLMSQNAKLLPYTANTAIATDPLGYAGALTAPRPTAEAKAHIANLDLTLNSRIMSWINFTAGVRYYDFANKTEALDLPGFSPYDQGWTSGPLSIEPFSFSRMKLFADMIFNVIQNTSLKVGYDYSTIKRLSGAEGAEAESGEDKDKEGTFHVSLDSSPLNWLDLRVAFLTAKRDWTLDGGEVAYIPGFNFKRYFEANRDRQGLNLLLGLSPMAGFDVQFSYMFGRDKYPQSSYGLKKNDFDVYGVDLSYALGKLASLYGFYSYENYKADQASRQSDSSTFSTDSGDDWTANLKDAVNTFGGGLNTVLKKDALNLDLSASYSKAKGTAALLAAPGGIFLTRDAVQFANALDQTELLTLQAKLLWKMMTHFSVALGYWYEQYKLNDIVGNDPLVDSIIPVSVTGGASAMTAIYLGAIAPGYRYHVAYLNFICTW